MRHSKDIRWQQYKYALVLYEDDANEHPSIHTYYKEKKQKNTCNRVCTKKSAHCDHETLFLSNCIWLFSQSVYIRRSHSYTHHHTWWLCEISSQRVNIICTLKQNRRHKIHAMVMKTQNHLLTLSVLHAQAHTHSHSMIIWSRKFFSKEFILNISSPVFAAHTNILTLCTHYNAHYRIHMQINRVWFSLCIESVCIPLN